MHGSIINFSTTMVAQADRIATELEALHNTNKLSLVKTPLAMTIYFCALEIIGLLGIAYHSVATLCKIIPATVKPLFASIPLPGFQKVALLIPDWLNWQSIIWSHLFNISISTLTVMFAPFGAATHHVSDMPNVIRGIAKMIFGSPQNRLTKPSKPSRAFSLLALPLLIAVTQPVLTMIFLNSLFDYFRRRDTRTGGQYQWNNWGGYERWEWGARNPENQITWKPNHFEGLERCKIFSPDNPNNQRSIFDKCYELNKINEMHQANQKKAILKWFNTKNGPTVCKDIQKAYRKMLLVLHQDKMIDCSDFHNKGSPAACISAAFNFAEKLFKCELNQNNVFPEQNHGNTEPTPDIDQMVEDAWNEENR